MISFFPFLVSVKDSSMSGLLSRRARRPVVRPRPGGRGGGRAGGRAGGRRFAAEDDSLGSESSHDMRVSVERVSVVWFVCYC